MMQGLAAHMLIVGAGSIWLDWIISPTMARNLQQLEQHGYSTPFVLALMACNLVATDCLVAAIVNGFGCFEAEWSVTWNTALAVSVNLVLAEITFTAGHFLLHQTKLGGRLHTLHHCCRPCSWSTNLLFHPVDMAVEFSGPFAAITASHVFVFQDPLALFVTVHFLHVWYALDHSENLRFAHFKHHLYVDSTYTIYCGGTVPNLTPDTVKPLLHAFSGSAKKRQR